MLFQGFAYRFERDLLSIFFFKIAQIRVREALTGFHCGSHSSLISLTETAFCDAVADPIKIAAGEIFMVVKFSRCE